MSDEPSTPVQQAQAAILASIEAFGDAATEELARPDVDRKTTKANLATLHRRRRAEVKRIAEAFTRSSVTKEDRALLQSVLEVSLKALDGLYKDFRRGGNVLHNYIENSPWEEFKRATGLKLPPREKA